MSKKTDEKITFACNYCNYETYSRQGIATHITTQGKNDENDPHHGKQGTNTANFAELVDTSEIEKNNERVKHEGENTTYVGPAEGINMSYQHITERDSGVVTDLETEEKVMVGLTIDQIGEIISEGEISNETRNEIIEQLVKI